jgi:hypothetical protein
LESTVTELMVARASEGRVDPGPVLTREFGGIWNIRIAPGDGAVAYVVADVEMAKTRLAAVGASGAQPAKAIDEAVAGYPDWSPDGKSLVYIRAAQTNAGADIVLASLSRRRVVNDRGQIEVPEEKEELAGLMFNSQARVRCLRDGRILFASEEWRLPVTTVDLPQRQQLFALDPERQSTLTPLVPHGSRETLPEALIYFEVSPDEKRVAIAGDKGMVAVFTLASGKVEVVCGNSGEGDNLTRLPSWRSAAELGYIAHERTGTNELKAEVALWQPGKTNMLSRAWPEKVRKGLLD